MSSDLGSDRFRGRPGFAWSDLAEGRVVTEHAEPRRADVARPSDTLGHRSAGVPPSVRTVTGWDTLRKTAASIHGGPAPQWPRPMFLREPKYSASGHVSVT